MALLTGSDVLGTAFIPAAGSFIVQVSGGEAVLDRRNTTSAAWSRLQPVLDNNSTRGGTFVIENPIEGAEYRFMPLNGTTPIVRADQFGAAITANGATAVGNATAKFRDNFIVGQPDTTVWDLAWSSQGTSSITKGGDTAGASYLRLSMCPFSSTALTLTSRESFKFPQRLVYALSQSQRISGQELEISLVGCNDNNVVETVAPLPSQAISGTITVATNVATINFATPHDFKGGDRVQVSGCTDPRLNTVPAIVTVVTNLQITIPLTLANGTYTAGGTVTGINTGGNISNTTGFLYENLTLTNGTFYSKRNGESVRSINATIATNTATQLSTSPFCDAFNAANVTDILSTLQDVVYTSRPLDGLLAPSGILRWNTVPDEEKSYKIRIRARNHDAQTKPIARITSISKAGTTTANVITDVPHNLTTSSFVQIQGVRDIANFPALASTQVASIVSPTEFTIVIGAAVTANSAGGMVILNQGSLAHVGSTGLSVQSISRTSNILSVVVNTTATGALAGEFWHLYGCDATSMGLYDGAYKILRMTGSTYDLESVGADFATINCGGSLFKRTDHRIHNVQMLEYTRHIVELSTQNGSLDIARSLPVNVTATIPAVSTVSAVTNAGTPAPPATPYILNSLATTNGALILTGTSGLHAFYATNIGATPAFVKLYNKATAPTVGTDVPAMIIPIPAAVAGVPGTATLPIGTNGFRFALGLGIAITGAVGDSDTTAIGAGQVKVMLSRTV